MRRLLPPVLILVLAACANAGEGDVLAIRAGGQVTGFVYLDRNGSLAPDVGDTVLSGVRVALVVRGTRDSVAHATSDTLGFDFRGVAAGRYTVVVDTLTLAGRDSLTVVRTNPAVVTIAPGDVVNVELGIGLPHPTIAEARLLPAGRRIFLDAVALNAAAAFGDSVVHVADSTGAIRAAGVHGAIVFAGDSLRLRGTTGSRGGQPTVEQTLATLLAFPRPVPRRVVTTAAAADAAGGSLDAFLVEVDSAVIEQALPAPGMLDLRANDGTGPVRVQLDSVAGFSGVALAGDTVGALLNVTGLLVPGGPGVWVLRPRAPSDVVAP